MIPIGAEGRLCGRKLGVDEGCRVGTGIWAVDMAEKYPSAIVTGMDLRFVERSAAGRELEEEGGFADVFAALSSRDGFLQIGTPCPNRRPPRTE